METEDKDIVNAILSNTPLHDSNGGSDDSGNDAPNGGADDNGGGGAEPHIPAYKDEHGEYNFGRVFGQEYTDPTKIKPILERAAKLPEIETELETLRTTKTQYEQELQALKTKPTYKNPLFFKLDKIAEESPNELPLYQSFAFGSLSDEDLVKADMKQRYPELAKDEDSLKLMLSDTYGVYFDEENDPESREYQAAAMRLKMKATDLRAGIQSRLDKIEVPDAAKLTLARQEETKQLVEKWKEPFGKIAKSFSKLSLTVPDDKDPKKEVMLMELDIPESERGVYLQMASQHIASSRLSPDNGGAEQLSQLMRQMYIVNNFSSIVAKVAEKASTATNGKWRDFIHNTGRKENAPGQQHGGGADIGTQLMDKMRADGQL